MDKREKWREERKGRKEWTKGMRNDDRGGDDWQRLHLSVLYVIAPYVTPGTAGAGSTGALGSYWH